MTPSLYAGLAVAVCSVLGMLFGYGLGRRDALRDERGAWVARIRKAYDESKHAEAFRVAMLALANRVERSGWKQ